MDISWDAVAGHEANIARLKKLAASRQMPHALLFTGPVGIGKQRLARVMAAALLCGRETAPCGSCESCRQLRNGIHPDYYELQPEIRGKALRLIRIDAIREMQGVVQQLPALAKCQVVVINDADTMNEAAANSLLKTLEEPAGEVYFILITDKPDSLLDTIRSRCVLMKFSPLEPDIVAGLLQKSGVPAVEAAELACMSDGSVGKALHLRENGGLEHRDDALEFLQSLVNSKSDGFDLLTAWAKSKALSGWEKGQLVEWLTAIMMLCRDMLVLSNGSSGFTYNSDKLEQLGKLLPALGGNAIGGIMQETRQLQYRLQYNVSLQLQLDGYFIKILAICHRL